MEILDNQFTREPGGETGLHVTKNLRLNWHSISKWALFFAILGFIIAGISLLTISTIVPTMSNLMRLSGNEQLADFISSIGTVVVIITGAATIAMFFVHYFHLRFANGIQRAMQFNDQNAFESSWRNLRNHFRLYGILIISYIILYIIALIFMASFIASRPDF